MKKLFPLAAVLVFLGACTDDDDNQDTTAPVILEARVNGEDHDLEFNAGDALQLEVDLSDNEALGQLKIDVHDIFDAHSHGKKDGSAWEMTEVLTVSGANATVSHTLNVPDPVTAGPHHFIFRALDAAGNESDFMELNFILLNGEQPTFDITSPDFSSEVLVNKGSSLTINGFINDDVDLQEVLIVVKEEDDDGHNHKNASGEIFEYDVDLTANNDTSFDLSTVDIAIPATAETGNYELQIVAKDNEGNYGVLKADLHIL
jgi:hypothetical protein